MAIRLGDTAPDFTADTTEGTINFHEWIGDGWCVLFSHPKDFTPVCTTELGYMASLKPEFDKRRCKIMGLSIDPVGDHERWSDDIKDATGFVRSQQLDDYDVVVAAGGDGTVREVAEALQIPVGTVKSRLHSALLKLNQAWQKTT